MSEKIKAYFIRGDNTRDVTYTGYVGEIFNTLEAFQSYVNFDRPGGKIETISLTDDIICIVHEEGKLKHFPVNRVICLNGVTQDFLVGNILCVRRGSDGEFASIHEDDIPIIEKCLPSFGRELAYIKNVFQDIYPAGAVIELLEPLNDPFSPNPQVPECVSNMWMMQTRYMVAGWSQSLAHWRSLSVKTSFRWWMSRKLHIFRKTAGFFGIWRSFYALSKGRICRGKGR